jgi:AcrR family transcriptional regulator
MNQDERTQRSRSIILEAALRLFSHQGFRATSVREIADTAGVSTGNVYHHFRDKETIFHELLDQYWTAIDSADFPFNKALASDAFPDNLEAVGRAAREMVQQFRPYVALIYVDVVEFDGKHIRKFYSEMARRYEAFIERHRDEMKIGARLRPGVSPVSAVMLASRVFIHYFSIEILFGGPNHFGHDSEQVIAEVADMLRYGLLPARNHAPAGPVALDA